MNDKGCKKYGYSLIYIKYLEYIKQLSDQVIT